MRLRRAFVTLAAILMLAACTAGAGTTDSHDSSSQAAQATAPIAVAPTPLVPAPVAQDYDLGAASMQVAGGSAEFPVRGTIAFPPRVEGAPVALVLHMRGNPCLGGGEVLPCPEGQDARYDQGMGWLASALAARGYVAVVPDITATRDFRYEAVTRDLGWQLALESLEALRAQPSDLGVPAGVSLSDTTVSIGHSIGGDQALFIAIRNPGLIAAALLLEPAPMEAGLFPGPDNPYAYLYGTEQVDLIPPDLRFAVAIGRCDDDALYLGGQYTAYAAADPKRTAPAQLVVLTQGDHVMLNTRAGRESSGPWAGCVASTDPGYPAVAEGTRQTVATWSADTLDVFLDRQPADGQAARRAGLFPADSAQLAGASAVLIPPATSRTTALVPLGGILGPQGSSAPAADDPLGGADDDVTHSADGLDLVVCPAGGLTAAQATEHAPELAPCSTSATERPGDAPALHLRPVAGSGTWTATFPAPVNGTVLATITPEPDDPPTRVTVRAGGAQRALQGDALAVAARTGELPPRAIPIQVRLPAGAPITDIQVDVEGGSVFLQDLVVTD